MQVSKILNQAKKDLSDAGVDSAFLDAKILLSFVTNKSKEELFLYPDAVITQSELERFQALLEMRKARHPISHLIGNREFYGRDFVVTKDTLDPRPDTETLIDAIKDSYSKNSKFHFLDLGTGTGCIPITLLQEFPNSTALAIDISEQALSIAKQNTEIHKVEERLDFLQSNFFTALTENHKFDLIISNPPYIPTEDIRTLEKEVRVFEPNLALDGGNNGLDCYEIIAKKAHRYLNNDGTIFLEIGYNQEQDITEIFKHNGFKLESHYKDLGNIIRIVSYQRTGLKT